MSRSDPSDDATPRTLSDELKQTRPFRSAEQEAFLSLLRTADLARARFSALFDREGITFQQYNVLRILRGAGEQGLPTLEIGARMIERTPGVTRIVDRLVGKGWVVRERCEEDRRRVWCRITPEGLELLGRLDQPVDRTDRSTFEGLERGELADLIDTLEKVRTRLLGRIEDPGG